LEAGRSVLAYIADYLRTSQNEIQRDLRIGRGTWPGLRDLLSQIGNLKVSRAPAGKVPSVSATER